MEVLSMAGLALALAGVGDGAPPRVTVPLDVVTRGPLQDPPMVQAEAAGPVAVGDVAMNTVTTTTSMAFANHPSRAYGEAERHYARKAPRLPGLPDPGRRSIPPWARPRRRR